MGSKVLTIQRRQSWGFGGSRPADFGLEVVGSQEVEVGSWTGLEKHYSLFCTESTL